MTDSLLLALQVKFPSPVMSTGGWVLLGLAWMLVTGLALWCFARVIWGGKPS